MRSNNNTKLAVRVLMLVHDFPSVNQPFVLNQVVGLIDRGCDLTVVAKRSTPPLGDSRLPREVESYQLPERMIYLRTQVGPRIWSLFSTALRILIYVLQHPARFVMSMKIAARTGDYSALQILVRVRAIAQLGQIDVIHCQFGTAGNMGLLLRAVRAVPGAAVITSLRGSDITSVVRRKPHLYRQLVTEGDYFLPVCDHFKNLLLGMGVPVEKIEVHYSGIDLNKFPFAAEQNPTKGVFRVLAVGRLVEKKGYNVLLEAISKLRTSGKIVTLTIIGDGPLRESIYRRIGDLELHDSVLLRTWVAHTEVAREMCSHDVLAAPSLTTAAGELEGIPNVVKEAMASGLPVVCTRHSGIPDLITDGETGFLVPENDPEALAVAIAKLMEQPALMKNVRSRARERVEALMSTERLNDRLLTIYRTLAAKNVDVVRNQQGRSN